MQRILATTALLLSFMQIWSQNILTAECNLQKDSDILCLQQVSFCHEGNDGDDVIWDFKFSAISDSNMCIHFLADSLGGIQMNDGQKNTKYCYRQGCLNQIGFEDRLKSITYYQRKLAMKYPFSYGDSVVMPFKGYGTYCGNHDIRVCGQVAIQADGYGTLILGGEDTLRNVLRVYTLTTTTMAVDASIAIIDSSLLKQEIEEKYDWYARGYRYPMVSIIQNTSLSNGIPVGTTRNAYRIVTENSSLSYDLVNDSILQADVVEPGKQNAQEVTFHYTVRDDGCQIIIEYVSDEDAFITALLSDSMGAVYKRIRRFSMAYEHETLTFDYVGLRRGQYIIYINVNGKVYSKTVNL